MVPHNIVVNENGDKMFVTHSGANATAVSTYSISNGVFFTPNQFNGTNKSVWFSLLQKNSKQLKFLKAEHLKLYLKLNYL